MRLTDWFGSFSLLAQALVLYLLIVNALTFLLFGLDKLKSATPGASRIRERTLWLGMAFGGSAGALFAMHVFRHKTQKTSFQAVMIVILLLQIALLFFLLRLSSTPRPSSF